MNRTATLLIGVVAILVVVVMALFLFGRQPETAGPSPSASASASPSFNEELLNARLTVLLVGIDTNEGRIERGDPENADGLLVVSVSADQTEVALVSLPRDTVDVPLADGGVYEQKINGMYATEGIDTMVGAFETLYGIPIDGYAVINMDGLVALVDAADGVTVNPPEPLTDPIVDLALEPGEQELEGPTALSYVRTRVDQDYGRMARQQEVVLDVAQRLADPETDVDLRGLLDELDKFETDLNLDDLPTYVEIARRAQEATDSRLVIGPPDQIVFEGDRGDGRGYVLIPDVDAIREAVTELIPPDE